MFWKCCESADFKEKHWFKMATPKVTFQTCCSNSLMFGLIWAIFLPGNVVFIMATHPVSIISIIFYTWLCFYGRKLPFVIISTGSSKKPSKPTQTYYIFDFFSRLEHGTCTSPLSKWFLQFTNIRGIPIAQEPSCFMVEFDLTFQATAHDHI